MTKEEAQEELRRQAPRGSTIYSQVHYVYPGNLRRIISFYTNEGKCLDFPSSILFQLQLAPNPQSKLALKRGIKQGLCIGGVGPDIGLWYTTRLSIYLYNIPDAFIYDRYR